MKVFVVTNQCLMHDSSYYEVIAVCDSLIKAQVVLGTCELDFIQALENSEANGNESVDFHTRSLSVEEDEKELTITDNVTGMFDKYTITEMEVKQYIG